MKWIVQVCSLNIDEAVELAPFVTDLGHDAIFTVTPFYYKFDFQEIKCFMTLFKKALTIRWSFTLLQH